MTVGLLLALTAAVGYGAADFIGGLGSRRTSPWQVVLVGQLAGATAMLVAALALPGRPGPADFSWAVLAGLGSAVGSIFLYRGLARGRMGVVAPLSAVGAAVLPAVVGVAGGERPTALASLGLLVALPGIWLVSRETSADLAGTARGALLDGTAAGLGFGLLFVALAQVSASAGLLPLAANQVVGAVLTVLVATAMGHAWRPRGAAVVRWGTVAGVLGSLATLAFLLASQSAYLSLTAVLASLYPVVTVLLAAVVLGERVLPGQRLGLLCCTAAVGLVAAG